MPQDRIGSQSSLRDITELRRIEDEIRHLNADLERRVQERTQNWCRPMTASSTTLESLQRTQDELVRAESWPRWGRWWPALPMS